MNHEGTEVAAELLRRKISRRKTLGGLAAGVTLLVTTSGQDALAAPAPRKRRRRAAGAQVATSSVAANQHNVLSAVVTVETAGIERLRVEYGAGGAFDQTTRELPISGATTAVPVLGLRPDTDYGFRVVAIGASAETATGDPLALRTGSIPDNVPSFEASSPGTPEPGYTLISPTSLPSGWHEPSTVVIVDATGRVVWYREVPRMALDFQLQPNGHFTAGISQPGPGAMGVGVHEEWDALGNLKATWAVQGYQFTDWHEIRLLNGGDEGLLLGYAGRTKDARVVGMAPDALLWGVVLQRLSRSGFVSFDWMVFDHLTKVEETNAQVWKDANGPRNGYDWSHTNAIEVDHDGHYIISSRHLNEVTKIDSTSGEVLWRMGGGPGNQFTFVEDPLNGFSAQHAPRKLENGNLLILDNGNAHRPQISRAVEYEVDEENKTARHVWSYSPGSYSSALGNAQRLPNGNTLVNVGRDYRVVEVTPDGEIAWELRVPIRGWGATAWRAGMPAVGNQVFNYLGIYRALHISSLEDARL